MSDVYRIVYYGDKRLTAENDKITEVNKKIKEIAQKMINTMKEQQGIGLAGPQVGINKKIVVIDLSFGQEDKNKYMVLLNPEIIKYSEKTDVMEEGCLSFPELFIEVERSKEIKVKARTLEDEEVEFEADSFLARVLQHEIDHINGIVFVDRISPAKKLEISDKLNKIKNLAEVI
ncbi:MAG: peptide deformylase [Candidatus Mcinerneyibacterium aminivorans]|uniref:Peptide deformylase n=1 Tax=Candidatus Mcinerneyibacterium aminivorans TaxID=2703815 RepID=A0A5D0MFW3_9BACT|nr:MAG: peptide deformylase [Candidatus Mcinerneyibacterium aminivorans]